MIARLIVFGTLAALAAFAARSSYAGSGARELQVGQSPAVVIAAHQDFLDAEAARAARAELDRRYQTGDMGVVERAEYEQMIEQERAEEERQAQIAAAAAARAAYLRNTRRTGGGPSGGK